MASAAQWASMVHPSGQGVPGARITAVTMDGRNVDVFNEAGQFGLKRMIDTAARQKRDDGAFELRWSSGAITVAMGLKIISSPDKGGATPDQGLRGLRLPETIAGAPAAGAPPQLPAVPTAVAGVNP